MTGEELKAIRVKLFGDKRGAIKEMALSLETPYRTYQDWELGNRPIPGAAAVAAKLLAEKGGG